MESLHLEHILGQIKNANVVLYCGAGLSKYVHNHRKESLPIGHELAGIIWPLAYPNEPFEQTAALADVYGLATKRNPQRTITAIQDALRVAPESIPSFIGNFVGLPWKAIYTTNLDDLLETASQQYRSRRLVVPVSATKPRAAYGEFQNRRPTLDCIHLNGTMDDLPDFVTFSPVQYSRRLTTSDPMFDRLASDIVTSCTIFVGTSLNEPSLWSAIELRKARAAGSENRSKSYLIARNDNRARMDLLREEYNIRHIGEDAKATFEEILGAVTSEATSGFSILMPTTSAMHAFKTIDQIEIRADWKSEFLSGADPDVNDIYKGMTIRRRCDDEIAKEVRMMIEDTAIRTPRFLAVTGTAASGKTTSLLQLAVDSSAKGIRTSYIDRHTEIDVRHLVDQCLDRKVQLVILDDIDRLGALAGSLIRDFTDKYPKIVLVVGIRSTKAGRIISQATDSGVIHVEVSIPLLQDDDIDELIKLLGRFNRLGRMTGMSKSEMTNIFRDLARRQLVIAMIEATTGKQLVARIEEEYSELQEEDKAMYATVALVTHMGFSLTEGELLQASGRTTGSAINSVRGLIRRGLFITGLTDGRIRLRHRLIADIVVNRMKVESGLTDILTHVALTFASRLPGRPTSSSDREFRVLSACINHERLSKLLDVPHGPRAIYGELESILRSDHHYWLQRGSFEVEFGSVDEAALSLETALALNRSDPMVRTEHAYMRFRRAIEQPEKASSVDDAIKAREVLEELIVARNYRDYYPAHVLGSQTIAWTRRAAIGRKEKFALIERAHYLVSQCAIIHGGRTEIRSLLNDLTREKLRVTA